MDAYPLQWPAGWPRSKSPQPARFQVTMNESVKNLYDELDRLGASNIIVSSNMRLRLDGRPTATQNRLEDEGIAVYFTLSGAQQCIPCDKWSTVKDNVRAVGLTVAALRGLERWGAKEMVNAAFRGFRALPENIILGEHVSRPWHEVLQVSPNADQEIIRAAWKRLISRYHPDNTESGDATKFAEVQKAYNEVKK